MSNAVKTKGSGGLVQLYSFGTIGNYLLAYGDSAPFNMRDSMMHWFVGRDDGFATREDIPETEDRHTLRVLPRDRDWKDRDVVKTGSRVGADDVAAFVARRTAECERTEWSTHALPPTISVAPLHAQ